MRLPILLLLILGVAAGVALLLFPKAGSERAETLRAALRGADRLTVRNSELSEDSQPAVEISGAEKISELVGKLDFDDAESGFHCMCCGDTEIVFFKGDRQLAVLSHHHGRSLRWAGGRWLEDSLFTPQAAEGWRLWFKEQGEPRFEAMFQRDSAEAKRRAEVNARFLAAFPPEIHSLFDEKDEAGMRTFVAQRDDERPIETLSPRAEKLAAFFADRVELGRAVTRALGSLSVGEGWDGSWSSSDSREQLALECGRALTGDEFLAVVENGDDVSLVGAARLFFFEDMSETILAEKRGPLAARLAEVTLRSDRPGNADVAVRGLRRFPCDETTGLLERLAAGSVPYRAESPKNKDEPSPRAAACLLLAQTDSPKLAENLTELESSPNLDPFDKAALRIARSFRGEKGLLEASIFELDSYTIGYGALRAFEREGGKAAIDAVIYGGTKHSWGAVREEAVLTAERMTGQKWFKDDPKDCAAFHDEEVRKWWTENRATLPD